MTRFRPEIGLMLCAARTPIDAGTAEHMRALLEEGIDWQALLQGAERHGLMPLLSRALSNTWPDAVPREILDTLQARFRETARRNLTVTQQLIGLAQRFEAAGIPVLPFKGPLLAATLYGDLALRQIHDLDLLVRREDVRKASELLVSEGYQPEQRFTGVRAASSMRAQHHYAFLRDRRGVTVELHWRFAPAHYPFRLDMDRLWERLAPARLAGTAVRNLLPEDLLLVLCAHGFNHGWTQLNWICDVAQLLRAHPEIDGERVLTHARRLGCERRLLLGLHLAGDLLGAPLPSALQQIVATDSSVRGNAAWVRERLFVTSDKSAEVVDAFFLQLRALERRSDRARCALQFARRRMAPNDRDRVVLPLPTPLGFLHYATRPLRLAGRYGRQLCKGIGSTVTG